jgi:hypothetical protein
MKTRTNTIAVLTAAALGVPAMAGYTITQGSTAPTYSDYTLNFDEPGGPSGLVAPDAWLGSHGITEMQAGDGGPQVDNWDPIFGGGGGWLGDGQSFFGNFGVFMTFENDLSTMAIEVWDPSGPPEFFGGGLNVILFNDGVEVADLFAQNGDIATPAWGGVGDSWFDIVADGGDTFDEVRILGFGFSPTTFVDNMSWDLAQVPAPGALALLGLAGLTGRRRRDG